MDKISVVVSGTGFMGREVLAAVTREPDLEPSASSRSSPRRIQSLCRTAAAESR